MEPESWRWTLIGTPHPEVAALVTLQAGEVPIVSCHISGTSWYLFTTRRVVGCFRGTNVEFDPTDVIDHDWANFKGYGGVSTASMVLKRQSNADVSIEYETGKASMAPIYYLRYWTFHYPGSKLRQETLGQGDS
jgi:hypothetical protein